MIGQGGGSNPSHSILYTRRNRRVEALMFFISSHERQFLSLFLPLSLWAFINSRQDMSEAEEKVEA